MGYKRNLLIEILNIRCLVVFEGYKGNLFIENIKRKVKIIVLMDRLEKRNDR